MNFMGTVIATKRMESDKPMVLVRAHHDYTLETWAEWQTDLRGGNKPMVGNITRVQSYGPIKIAK